MPVVLALLDWSLTAIHLLVVVANLVLWVPRSLRRWHLLLVALTAASWLGLGLVFGLGYCVLTDLQWAVKSARGISPLPHSFIHYVLVDGLQLPLSHALVDRLSAFVLATVVCLSVALNLKAWFAGRQAVKQHLIGVGTWRSSR